MIKWVNRMTVADSYILRNIDQELFMIHYNRESVLINNCYKGGYINKIYFNDCENIIYIGCKADCRGCKLRPEYIHKLICSQKNNITKGDN